MIRELRRYRVKFLFLKAAAKRLSFPTTFKFFLHKNDYKSPIFFSFLQLDNGLGDELITGTPAVSKNASTKPFLNF